MNPLEIMERLHEIVPPRQNRFGSIGRIGTLVVISGGEPLIQAVPLLALARLMWAQGYTVHIETAGTRYPGQLASFVDTFVVSPKLENSGNLIDKRFRPAILREFATTLSNQTWFKFVVEGVADLKEVDYIVNECNIRRDRVMIMPEGTKTDKIIAKAQEIVVDVLGRGYGLTLRNHVFIWDDVRAH
ncbi:MAG: hypothetical protein ABSG46_20395 [Candidatus Binataceae bacterium]